MSFRCFSILSIGVVLPAFVSAQPLTFTRADRASTSSARGIATADFNRDGWIDIVTAHNEPDGLGVLLNRGTAGGYDASFIALPGGPFDVSTGDLNKDGLADIAVANADANEINVLFGRAEGGFTPPLTLPGGGNPRGLAIADVDRDGSADIVFTEFGAARVTIYWGNGAGSFSTRPPVSLSTPSNPQGVAIADFDADGRPDIATVSSVSDGRGVTIHFANPTPGTFWRWDITWTPALNVIAIGDLDKDGRPDIAAAGSSTSDITTLLNTRAGWILRAPFPSGGSSPRGIAVVDLNRDGALDLVTGNRGTSTVQVALNKGDGSFAAPEGIASGTGSRAVAVGDFDHDGRIDVATANEYAATAPVLSNTTAFPQAAFKFRRQWLGPGDDNGSGADDIAWATGGATSRHAVRWRARSTPRRSKPLTSTSTAAPT